MVEQWQCLWGGSHRPLSLPRLLGRFRLFMVESNNLHFFLRDTSTFFKQRSIRRIVKLRTLPFRNMMRFNETVGTGLQKAGFFIILGQKPEVFYIFKLKNNRVRNFQLKFIIMYPKCVKMLLILLSNKSAMMTNRHQKQTNILFCLSSRLFVLFLLRL